MSGLRGVFAGVLALIALETIVSTSGAADRTAGLFGTIAGLVTRMLDPTVAAIPDVAGVYHGGGAQPPSWGGLKPPASAPDPPANGKAKPPKVAPAPTPSPSI